MEYLRKPYEYVPAIYASCVFFTILTVKIIEKDHNYIVIIFIFTNLYGFSMCYFITTKCKRKLLFYFLFCWLFWGFHLTISILHFEKQYDIITNQLSLLVIYLSYTLLLLLYTGKTDYMPYFSFFYTSMNILVIKTSKKITLFIIVFLSLMQFFIFNIHCKKKRIICILYFLLFIIYSFTITESKDYFMMIIFLTYASFPILHNYFIIL